VAACGKVPYSYAGGPTPADSLSPTATSPQIFHVECYGYELAQKIMRDGVAISQGFYFKLPFFALKFRMSVLKTIFFYVE
jgi:hypothetical protein